MRLWSSHVACILQSVADDVTVKYVMSYCSIKDLTSLSALYIEPQTAVSEKGNTNTDSSNVWTTGFWACFDQNTPPSSASIRNDDQTGTWRQKKHLHTEVPLQFWRLKYKHAITRSFFPFS